MTPEELVEKLKKACPDELKSVVLYGSAAAGDHAGKHSDYNILVVTEKLDTALLKAISKPTQAWIRKGNPPPLLFTAERLNKSADVFPIELLDMKDARKILFGEDILEKISVTTDNLRLELEHELRGKLIQLRERFLITGGKRSGIVRVMIRSLSTFLVLFRAALRLYQDDIPQGKLVALQALNKHIDFDAEVFITINDLKTGGRKPKDLDAEQLFDRYLKTVESIVDAVDTFIRKEQGEEDHA